MNKNLLENIYGGTIVFGILLIIFGTLWIGNSFLQNFYVFVYSLIVIGVGIFLILFVMQLREDE